MVQYKLMNEYGAAFPLWIDGFYEGEEPFAHLSEELREELRSWADGFDHNFSPFSGWSSEAARDGHVIQARQLFDRVRRELGPEAEVVLDVWEASDEVAGNHPQVED
jgi:hypothetical protein